MDENLWIELGKEFQNEVARKVKDLLKEAVLWKGIYKFVGWDLVFKECTEEHGVNKSRI